MSLTNRPLDVVSEPDRPARETDVEECEVEITPEMIVAGRRALDSFSLVDLVDGWQSVEEVVCEVFAAMAEAGGLTPRFGNVPDRSHRLLMSSESVGKFLRQYDRAALSGEKKVPQQAVYVEQ
jgi:hypothetical protein